MLCLIADKRQDLSITRNTHNMKNEMLKLSDRFNALMQQAHDNDDANAAREARDLYENEIRPLANMAAEKSRAIARPGAWTNEETAAYWECADIITEANAARQALRAVGYNEPAEAAQY